MNAVARIRFDEEALADYLKATPDRARLVARRLANGASPRELILCGGAEPALLDDLLCDVSARGLVIGIEGTDGEDMLRPAVADVLQHTDTRASFAPHAATPSPVPALADALNVSAAIAASAVPVCSAEESAPICTSPTPGAASSLEDAVLREVIHCSPEPAQALLAVAAVDPPAVVPPTELLRQEASPLPTACEEEDYGTPPAEQILALGEATVIDNTVYREERSVSIAPPAADLARTRTKIRTTPARTTTRSSPAS